MYCEGEITYVSTLTEFLKDSDRSYDKSGRNKNILILPENYPMAPEDLIGKNVFDERVYASVVTNPFLQLSPLNHLSRDSNKKEVVRITSEHVKSFGNELSLEGLILPHLIIPKITGLRGVSLDNSLILGSLYIANKGVWGETTIRGVLSGNFSLTRDIILEGGEEEEISLDDFGEFEKLEADEGKIKEEWKRFYKRTYKN